MLVLAAEWKRRVAEEHSSANYIMKACTRMNFLLLIFFWCYYCEIGKVFFSTYQNSVHIRCFGAFVRPAVQYWRGTRYTTTTTAYTGEKKPAVSCHFSSYYILLCNKLRKMKIAWHEMGKYCLWYDWTNLYRSYKIRLIAYDIWWTVQVKERQPMQHKSVLDEPKTADSTDDWNDRMARVVALHFDANTITINNGGRQGGSWQKNTASIFFSGRLSHKRYDELRSLDVKANDNLTNNSDGCLLSTFGPNLIINS